MIVNASSPFRKFATFTLLPCCLVLFAMQLPVADNRFDGKWRLSLTYSKASSSDSRCSGHLLRDPMTISNGKLSGVLNHSGRGTCFMSGAVKPNGALENAECDSSRAFILTGRLGGGAGNGTWRDVETNTCDGLWTAKKIK